MSLKAKVSSTRSLVTEVAKHYLQAPAVQSPPNTYGKNEPAIAGKLSLQLTAYAIRPCT